MFIPGTLGGWAFDGFPIFLSGNPTLLFKTLGFRRTGSGSGENNVVQIVDLKKRVANWVCKNTAWESKLYYTHQTICHRKNMDSLATAFDIIMKRLPVEESYALAPEHD